MRELGKVGLSGEGIANITLSAFFLIITVSVIGAEAVGDVPDYYFPVAFGAFCVFVVVCLLWLVPAIRDERGD